MSKWVDLTDWFSKNNVGLKQLWLWGVFSSFLECWIVKTNWPINSPRWDVWNEPMICDVPTKNEFLK